MNEQDIWQQAVNEVTNAAPAQPDFSDGSAIVNEATVNGAMQKKQQEQMLENLQQILTNPNLSANIETSALARAIQENAPQQQSAPLGIQHDYSRSSDDYYESAYTDLLRRGYTTKEAEYGAAKAAADYKANRLAHMQMQMENGGVDPQTGAITNLGLQTLVNMQEESPEAAALWSHAYDLPKAIYGYTRDIAKADHNAQNALDKAIKIAEINYKYNQMGANAQLGRQVQLANYKAQMDEAIRKGRQQEAIQMAINLAKAEGASDQEAQIQAYRYVLGGGGSGSRGGRGSGEGKEEKLSASDQKSLNEFSNLYKRAVSSLDGDDVQAFMDAVASNGMKFDDDTYSVLNAMQYALNARRELTAWNDSGQNYIPENALEYANAVISSGHGYLLNGMENVLQAAYKKQK